MPLGSRTYSSLTFSKHSNITALKMASMNITSSTCQAHLAPASLAIKLYHNSNKSSSNRAFFQTQLFNKFNNEKRGRFFTKIVKNLPQNGGRRVHFSSLGRKMALASIYFTPWERHEKTPEAVAAPGVQRPASISVT